MSTRGEQVRAVFLAALMVISVFGMTAAFTGSAAAAATNASATNQGDTVGDDVTFTVDVDNGETVTINNTVDGEVRESITVTDNGTLDEDSTAGTIEVTLHAGKTYNSTPDGNVTVTDSSGNVVSDTYNTTNYLVDVTDEVTQGETTQIQGEIFEYYDGSSGDHVTTTMNWSLQFDPSLDNTTNGTSGVSVLADSDTGDGTFVVTRTFDKVDDTYLNDYPSNSTDGDDVDNAGPGEPGYVVYVNESGGTSPADNNNDGWDVIDTRLNVDADTDPVDPVYKDTTDVINGLVENADGGLADYQIQFKDPAGSTAKTTTSAGTGEFSFTAELSDAGTWNIGTSEGEFIPYKDIVVDAQTPDMTFESSGDNYPNFQDTYTIQLNDSRDGFALQTNGGPNQGEVEGYLNVSGPFESGSITVTSGDGIDTFDTDSDLDIEYFYINTTANGAVEFDATPVDEGSGVSVTLENTDGGETYDGLEETDDAADTPSEPDYKDTQSIAFGTAANNNIVTFDVSDETNTSQPWVSIDTDDDGEFGESLQQSVKVLPLQSTNQDRLISDDRVGNDSFVGSDGLTTYNFTVEIRNDSNDAYTFGGSAPNVTKMSLNGLGVNKTIESAGANGHTAAGDIHYIEFTPTDRSTPSDNITLTITTVDGSVTKEVRSDGLKIDEFQVDGTTTDTVQVGSDVNLTSVIQEDDGTPVNNGKVRLAQNGTVLKTFDARTGNTNDGEYDFDGIEIDRVAYDSTGDNIADTEIPLVFTAYQYSDANGDLALSQYEVTQAAVETLEVEPVSDLQIEFTGEERHEWPTASSETQHYTAGVSYENITITVTDANGDPVDLTAGDGGTVAWSDIGSQLISVEGHNVTLDSGASNASAGEYVITELNATSGGASLDDSAASNNITFNSTQEGSYDIDVVTPNQTHSDAVDEGVFKVEQPVVEDSVVKVWKSDGTMVNVSGNIETLTSGIDRKYQVEATVTDMNGTPINGTNALSDYANVNVTTASGASNWEFNGTANETHIEEGDIDNNGTFYYNVTPGAVDNVQYNVSQSGPVNGVVVEPYGIASSELSADTPTVNVFDFAGGIIPEQAWESSDQKELVGPTDENASVMTAEDGITVPKDVSNRVRLEAFPADQNDVPLPSVYVGIAGDDPVGENAVFSSTNLASSDDLASNYEEGQLGYFSFTPTGTGDDVIQVRWSFQNSDSVLNGTASTVEQVDVATSTEKLTIVGLPDNVDAGATVNGTVVDEDGNGVSLARVYVTDPAGNTETYTSDEDGVFSFNATEGGSYDVRSVRVGFEPSDTSSVSVAVPEASVTMDDQSYVNSTDTVTVASATYEGGDYAVAIHNSSAGSPGPIIGWANVTQGSVSDLTVTLDEEVSSNVTVTAMLHESFQGDAIVRGGSPVTDTASVTIGETTTVVDQYDADDDGSIDASELSTAFGDWQSGDLDATDLVAVFTAWQSS